MNDEQREVVRECVRKWTEAIRKDRYNFSVDGIDSEAEDLFEALRAGGMGDADSYQAVEDAVRYIKQHLADTAMHSQAFALSTVQNSYRGRCHGALGHIASKTRRKLEKFVHGFLNSPRAVLRTALLVWILGFVLLFMYSWVSGNPAVIYPDATPVPAQFYPYGLLPKN